MNALYFSLKIATAWIALAVVIALVLFSLWVPRLVHIIEHGSTAVATIDRLDCSNKGHVWYAFSVGSAQYHFDPVMGIQCEALHLGDHALIYYDVTDPNISQLTEPRSVLESTLGFIGSASLFLPTLIIFVYLNQSRKAATELPR
jgi:hypothetical protein